MMSLAGARMANTGYRRYINRSGSIAGFSVALSCGVMQAQENVFRTASARLPSVLITAQQGASATPEKTTDTPNASKPAIDVTSLKPDPSSATESAVLQTGVAGDNEAPGAKPAKDQSTAKNREPIVLPTLSIPNTSIPGAGKGATPEDFVRGRLPNAIALPYGQDRYGFWNLGYKTWTAPVFCAQPLYFEDTMLERHGHERYPSLQPLISGARFFGNVAFLPYNAYLQRPLEERYSTGHYRPGSSAPGLRQRAPYDAGALRFQLLTTGTAVIAVQP